MPELAWDPLNFLQCLEVEPTVDDRDTEYAYEVSDGLLQLHLTVWPLESVIALAIRRRDSEFPVSEYALYVRGQVTLGSDAQGEYLMMRDALPVPDRFAYVHLAVDLHNRELVPYGFRVRVRARPQIRIEYEYE